ncbi:uncharacterized protein BDV14DRAFT_171270 [Aspergillus stella-maris]|uniref:uncharacterized protein n=1 Tax=Aspergillus stella-maris TaxID=1810926 RepID=UPI003CCE1CD7
MHLSLLLVVGLLNGAATASRIPGWTSGETATGTTDPGVTANCSYWANDISTNATCAQVEDHFDISFDRLKAWNPSLLKDYCVLIEGWSYCVDGPADAVAEEPTRNQGHMRNSTYVSSNNQTQAESASAHTLSDS